VNYWYPLLFLHITTQSTMANPPKSSTNQANVIVVGAGPVGCLVMCRLAQAGLNVIGLEKAPEIPWQAKATHYAPTAVMELDKAGVVDECRKRAQGFNPTTVCWRDLNMNMLGQMGFNPDGTVGKHDMVCLPQKDLCTILTEKMASHKNASILFNHEVTALEQDDKKVTLTATDLASGEEKTFTADYVVGTDGGRGKIRKLIGQSLVGYTWPDQIVATNVAFDFYKYLPDMDSNFIIDPEHWVMFAKIQHEPELWRVSYGEKTGMTDEQLKERIEEKFEAFLPGPKPSKGHYEVKAFSPYKIHQRCVESMNVGRVCLAGDAAHLVNPFGGTGLTSGMCDGGNLADCIIGIYKGLVEPEFILKKYSEERRRIFNEFTDPVSTANKVRMHQDPQDVIKNDPFIAILHRNDTEEIAKLGAGSWAMQHDFSQYFKKGAVTDVEPQKDAQSLPELSVV